MNPLCNSAAPGCVNTEPFKQVMAKTFSIKLYRMIMCKYGVYMLWCCPLNLESKDIISTLYYKNQNKKHSLCRVAPVTFLLNCITCDINV